METKDEVLETAKKRFKLVCDTEVEQRRRERDDLRFQVPEFQWTDEARKERGAAFIAGMNIPARPTVSVSRLAQPIQLVLNQERNARLGVNVHPLTEFASRDVAEVYQGLYRKIERDSNAKLARSWAFERAVKAGRGAYRINLAYDEHSEFPWDLNITIDRILYQECVYFDPSAQAADWSDGEWAFHTAWLPDYVYRRLYPKSRLAHADRVMWEDVAESSPDWVSDDAMLVAEYFCKYFRKERVLLLADGRQVVVPEGEKLPAGLKIERERERKVPYVKWYKLSGAEIIEEQDWDGRYIPLVPVIGAELVPFDSERYWTGIIGPNKDAQRGYNWGLSAMIEKAALEPRAPWIGDPRQFQGFEAWWQQANLRNFPYLPANRIVDGQDMGLPQRTPVDSQGMGPSMMVVQQTDEAIQAGTFTFDASMGRLPQKDRSGRAILALQNQSDAGNSHWLDNLANVSLLYEAKVVLDLMPVAYDRPGRIAEILDGEDNPRSVMLNAPYVENRDGVPQPVPPGTQGAKEYNLKQGQYGITVTVGKSYQSRLQEGADEIGQILQAQPALMPLIGATYFRFRDFPGAQEIADILKQVRDKQMPGIGDENKPEGERAIAENAQLKQQLQQLQQMLQQAMDALKTEQVKQQATLQKAQIDADSRKELALIKAESDRQITELKAQVDVLLQRMDDATEMRKLGTQAAIQEHQRITSEDAADRSAKMTMAHEVAMRASEPLGSDED